MNSNRAIGFCAAALGAVAMLAGCAAPPPRTSSTQPASSWGGANRPMPPMTHTYDVMVVDIDKRPLQGVEVVFDFKDKGTSSNIATVQCVTDARGACTANFQVNRDPQYQHINAYDSTVTVTAKSQGFNPGVAFKSHGSYPTSSGRAALSTIQLFRPADYLTEAFRASQADAALREQATKFISLIRLQGLVVDTELQPRSVGTVDYKSRKYMRLVFASDSTFNSLKLSRYAIGQKHFDESVRKLLNPLNTHISNPKAFYGYDIVVKSSTRDFSKDSNPTTSLEYRFLMPQDSVRRYKDQDISGQQLIDQSVVLLNDERIDLKLQ